MFQSLSRFELVIKDRLCLEVFPEIMHDPLFSCYFNLIFRPNDFNLTFRPIFDDMAMECVVKSVIPICTPNEGWIHERINKIERKVSLAESANWKQHKIKLCRNNWQGHWQGSSSVYALWAGNTAGSTLGIGQTHSRAHAHSQGLTLTGTHTQSLGLGASSPTNPPSSPWPPPLNL